MKRRIVAGGDAYYHCMSRIVGGQHLLGDIEKEMLRTMVWKVAAFCGVEILTYAVMSNHIHILGLVTKKGQISDRELVRRYALLYGDGRAPWQPKPAVLEEWLRTNTREGQEWRKKLHARMGDISAFMKTLKQRFSVWYNHTYSRYGTLWADRFRSVLLEGDPRSLATVAAYIDLNPVRAGIVKDPSEYRWCGYGEAMGGLSRAREALSRVFQTPNASWRTVGQHYRFLLFGIGSGGRLEQAKIPKRLACKIIEDGGTIPMSVALRCRVRYFTEGAVLGSHQFINDWSRKIRPSTRAVRSPKPMTGAEWNGLWVFRKPKGSVYS